MIEIHEIQVVEMMGRQGNLLSHKPQSDPSCSLLDSYDWMEVTTKYAEENQRLKAHIAKLMGKRQRTE